jgi:3-hydroxyisobutyrate dehydrogenase
MPGLSPAYGDVTVTTVAFIGLGNMGRGMALRLLGAGYLLRVFNRTRSKAEEIGRAGAKVCSSPREACTGAQAVIAMTADDTSSRSVWLGSDGVLAARVESRAFAIECSTLSHEWVLQLARDARMHGLRYIDAPVTGPPDSAALGALTLLLGAEPQDLEAARTLLSSFANRIVYFGGVGAGTAYKLIVNMMGAVQIASLAEGMAVAERAGLSLKDFAAAIASGQAASPQVVRNAQRIYDDDHEQKVVFTPVLRLKDVAYALKFAKSLGMHCPFAQIAIGQLQRLIEMGYSSANESKIIEVARLQTTAFASTKPPAPT